MMIRFIKKHKILTVIAAALLLLLFVVIAVFHHFYSLMHYRSDTADISYVSENAESLYLVNERKGSNVSLSEDLTAYPGTDSDYAARLAENVSSEETEKTEESASATVSTDESSSATEKKELILPNDEDVYNVILVGGDTREDNWYGNSDAMVLLSINKKTEEMHLVSFMRDLYASIPGRGDRKLNDSCAIGGPALVAQVIEENYAVPIDAYAYVDFTGMVDVIDAIGGLQIEISDEEAEAANRNMTVITSRRDEETAPHLFSGGGTYEMDGVQAVAYCRIRNVGNADFERTGRQRTVLNAIFNKMKTLSLNQLMSSAETILPLISHNIDEWTMVSLLAEVPSFLKYDLSESRVPYDGSYSQKDEILVPDDMAETIERLHSELYGSESD